MLSDKPRVRSLDQTTSDVEAKHAFPVWRDTALALTGVTTKDAGEKHSFSASRPAAMAENRTLLPTKSTKIEGARSLQHIRRDARDDITIAFFLSGGGYQQQGSRGASLSPGDISIAEISRPYAAGNHEAYEEIRLIVSRSLFRAHVGEPELLSGRKIDSTPPSILFVNYLRTYAELVPTMSEAEASVAVESALHLLRGVTGVAKGEVSKDALRSLALMHIERSLHDPNFGPETLIRALHVSRSRLYAAFYDGVGIAATIRDARLDRLHRYLSSSTCRHESISTLIGKCGLADLSSVSKAFRRRFGVSPRAIRDGHR